jgi:dimethylargininase
MPPAPARIALTRQISSAIERCELTYVQRAPIDIGRARKQHQDYEQLLRRLGCQVETLPEEPELPDSVFVEDTAIVLEEAAVITRPGSPSRRPETPSIAGALARYRKLLRIEAPGTLDGGDVLRIGRTLYVGTSGRSNPEAIEQLTALLAPLGYLVRPVAVRGCLHLKTAVTQVAEGRLLINPNWVDRADFAGMRYVEVDGAEPFGANAVLIDDQVIYPASHPRTAERLQRLGIPVHIVDMSETEKAEGGVTCCSLLFSAAGA